MSERVVLRDFFAPGIRMDRRLDVISVVCNPVALRVAFRADFSLKAHCVSLYQMQQSVVSKCDCSYGGDARTAAPGEMCTFGGL